MKEINIIKKQIKTLLDFGYIYESEKGVYRGLGKDDTFYLKIKGELKKWNSPKT